MTPPPSTTLITCDNYINNKYKPPSSNTYLPVHNPSTSTQIGKVALSTQQDVSDILSSAKAAYPHWSQTLTMKSRVAILLKFHSLVVKHADELADLIVSENGKNKTEALADVAKGNETVEYACSLPQLAMGRTLKVSRGVHCQDRRDALGIVASIVPFNFPFMVPMWTVPMALVMGNCAVLKPSEKVPLTMNRVCELFALAGLPPGVFSVVNGSVEVVNALIDAEDVRAVTFVGSSPVAEIVSTRCRDLNKRVTALGGAKNHLVALEDCDVESASSDVVVSYAGCAGQRCMAASVLLLVGEQKALLDKVVEKASQIPPGVGAGCMGPVIDEASYDKIMGYIAQSEQSEGVKLLLDGRGNAAYQSQKESNGGGHWIGPTIIHHSNPKDAAMTEEVFGPVLSVYNVSSWEEAIQIENSNPFGNAACVYTTNGGSADWFINKFKSAMLGINIGIPVPREPFSFGGLYGTKSKFGDMDITGDGGMEFFTNRVKVTTKWPTLASESHVKVASSATATTSLDHANFAGSM